ncbi:hypothetical protein [Symbiopectobacterium sp. RP]|uniref:hypothetical protein n=1 Tax=Symbiopectobacterium sp. RP TaxID=3248553 RepID=UPI003D2A3431
MFKLIITLINHEAGDRRELVHNGRYNTRESAWKDAQKMAYVHKNAGEAVTHEYIVRIVEDRNV